MTKNKVVRGLGWGIFCLIFLWQGCQNSSSEHAKLLQKGEELYRMGTSSNHQSSYEESTNYLKQAEEILESIQPSAFSFWSNGIVCWDSHGIIWATRPKAKCSMK